jgi:hypothetical protein
MFLYDVLKDILKGVLKGILKGLSLKRGEKLNRQYIKARK